MRKLLTTVALTLSAVAAQAGNTILGADFGSGSTYNTTFADGVNAAFTPTSGHLFEMKSQDGVTGVGVSGETSGEIDIGETITGIFSKGVQFSSIRLGLLFDGPEYNDVNEVAQITAFWTGGSTSITLTATGLNSAVLTGSGSFASVGSGAKSGGTGAWDIFNPFGNQKVEKVVFSSLKGIGCSGCTNQTDYTLVSVTAVPEPESYAMMLAGLGLMGAIARRRKPKAA